MPLVVFLDRPILTEVDVATDDKSMAAGVFVSRQDGILTMISADSPPATSNFRALQPGQRVTLSDNHSVFVAVAGSDGSVHTAGLPGPGNYVLRLVVGTWRFDRQTTAQWTNRWAESGELWTGAVPTQTIPITIARNPKVVSCND
jgi:hypothetical protein